MALRGTEQEFEDLETIREAVDDMGMEYVLRQLRGEAARRGQAEVAVRIHELTESLKASGQLERLGPKSERR